MDLRPPAQGFNVSSPDILSPDSCMLSPWLQLRFELRAVWMRG